MNILLIEDNPDHADLIMESAQEAFEHQATIDWHTRLESGLKKIVESRYDLCLCDLNLPDADAEETAELLGALHTKTPLVVLTSFEDENLARKLIHRGVQDYLPKEDLKPYLLRRIGAYAVERKRHMALIEARNADQELFCQSLSHDFKGPVRRFIAMLDLLRRDISNRTELTEQESRYFEFLGSNLKSIADLVDSLSQYLKLEGGDQRMLPVDLNNVISEAQAMVELNQEPSFRVNVMPLPTVTGNHSQLVILFANLISNAVKFSDGESIIDITGHSDELNRFCVIEVRDNGIGIEKQYQSTIFQPFRKLHPVGEYTGSGLGLSMVKRVVDNHHGDISVDSELGCGSTFTIRLPFF